MGDSSGSPPTKPKSRLKAILALAVIVGAAIAGGYYFISRPSAQFTVTASPTFVRVIPGTGAIILVNVTRSSGFTQDVSVAITNPPSWLNYQPITIPSSANSGNLTIVATQDAPKTSAQLTITATAPNVSPEATPMTLKVVGSINVANTAGTAQIYDTTKVLDNVTAQAVLSYSNVTGTVTFSQSTPQLQTLAMGDVIVLPPSMSSNVPKGFSRTVLNVQNNGGQVLVLTQQANLLDIFLTLKMGSSAISNSSQTIGSAGGFSINSISPNYYSEFRVPCQDSHVGNSHTIWQLSIPSPPGLDAQLAQGGGNVHLTGYLANAQLCVYGGVSIEWDVQHPVPTVHYAEIDLTGIAGTNLDLTGTAGSTINWGPTNLMNFFQNTIVLFPPLLWIDLGVYLEGVASGHIGSHDIHLSVDYQIGFVEGPEYCDSSYCGPSGPNGWGWDSQTYKAADCTICDQGFAAIQPLAGTSFTIGLGPHAHGDVNSGLASIDLSAHLDSTFTVQIPHNPVWWIDGSLDATLTLGALWGIASWSPGDWTCCHFNIYNGPAYPPEPPVLNIPSTTLDFTKGLTDYQWSATVVDPQGDDICGGQGSVTWYSGLTQDGTQGEIGTGCSVDASKVAWSSSGKRLIWAVAKDSAGLTSDVAKSIAAAITVNVILPGATVQIISAPTVESGQPPNTLYQGKTYSFAASVYVAYGSYQAPLDCSIVRWEVAIPPASPVTWGTGCTFNWAFHFTGFHVVTAVATYNGQDVSSKPLNYTIVTAPSGTTAAPSVQITSPAQNAQLSVTGNPAVAGQATDTAEMITLSEMQWSASWTDANGKHTVPVMSVQGTLTGKEIVELGGSGGTMYETFNWDLSQWCATAGPEGYSRGYVLLTLVAVDSKGQQSQPATVQVDLSCAQFGTMPPIPAVALVTMLAVLFTVTVERKTLLKSKLSLRL